MLLPVGYQEVPKFGILHDHCYREAKEIESILIYMIISTFPGNSVINLPISKMDLLPLKLICVHEL